MEDREDRVAGESQGYPCWWCEMMMIMMIWAGDFRKLVSWSVQGWGLETVVFRYIKPSGCYIIKEWFLFFYFNLFSLIIFYHSVWLGFELFGFRVQVCSQLVQFTLAYKGYDNHHWHNKPQTGNGVGVWMTSCPEEMGREFGRFWKRFTWVPIMVLKNWCRQTIELLPFGQRMEFSAIELRFFFFTVATGPD